MRWQTRGKQLPPLIVGLLQTGTALACTVCDSAGGRAIRHGLSNGHPAAMLWQVMLPVPVLWGIVGAAHFNLPAQDGGSGSVQELAGARSGGLVRPLATAGMVLGIGMGGFVDGILFHQILQLHNMLSNTVPRDSLVNEQINMVWDGFFHALTWSFVAVGIWLLWKALTRENTLRSGLAFWGALLFGWGAFNVVEGVIDHEILQLHHVYQNGAHLLWDTVFLVAGLVLMAAGWIMIRRGSRSTGQTL